MQGTQPEKTQPGSSQGNQHGEAFSDGQADDCAADPGRLAVGMQVAAEQVYTAYPCQLFQDLCQRRDAGPFDTIKIPVDQRVGRAERDGKGKDTKQWAGAFFQQKTYCNIVCIVINQPGTEKRQRHGQQKPGTKDTEGSSVIMGGGFRCSEFGDSGLNTGSRQRERKCHNGSKELIDSHTFFTKGTGQEGPVKKADKAADKSCQGQNQCTGQERIAFSHKIPELLLLLINYMCPHLLTEPTGSAIV